MAGEYFNYIDGKWQAGRAGRTFGDLNPANKTDVIGVFPRSDASDVEVAVKAAQGHYPRWRKVPAPRRAEIMFRAAEIMVHRKDELARLMTREMGKVLKEASGDVQEAIDMTYYIAGEGRRLFGQTTPSELPDKFAVPREL